ncbi:guanine deaminase [Methylohalobius crimeensis]|uniref:guanine deaminase n=1 Tax=Methylohalobius crimeensis TaxID=244365 RepID=UPI0003B50FCE|nr:guanine deaminase [Methylohalobius crimeensis]
MSTVYLGTVAHLQGDPFAASGALEIIERGALWVGDDGRIVAVGERDAILPRLPASVGRVEYREGWILPGLIDAHLHFPQYYAVAAPNRGLLRWLRETIFPAEAAFRDRAYAARVADKLIWHLLRGGVTCAMVFGSQFLDATEALFEAAGRGGVRLIAGVTVMDRDGPEELLTDPETVYRSSEAFIRRYAGHPRLHYALTPRFALTSSVELMEALGALKKRYPQVYLQTHINETREEIAAVARDFPQASHYLDVYDRFGLLGDKTILAHNIHPGEMELARLAESGCGICHCPSSNLFLGSGLFPLERHLEHGVPLAIGTDIGAGLNFSVWGELAEAHKVQRLRSVSLDAGQLLYWVTLGAARALGLDREIGNFEAGKWADFWVLAPNDDDYLNERLQRCRDLEDALFVLMHLAARSPSRATYVAGKALGGSFQNHGRGPARK